MIEKNDLLTYYTLWVNGETLSRRRLLAQKPANPPTATFNAVPVVKSDRIRLPLGQYSDNDKNDVKLAVDASRLEPIHQVIVHGSQATNDTCDFSDVDVLVVLDDSRPYTARQHHLAISELKALLRSIFLYDCLMHHGLKFMVRSGFEDYSESFLPVDTLRKATVLYGPLEVTLTTSSPRPFDQKQRLISSITSLRRRLERGDHKRDDYTFKLVLSGLLLTPLMLLESVNIFCYKKDSFSKGPREFPGLDWSAIRLAEDLRLRWKRPPTRISQKIVSKIMHPHMIIRLSRSHPPRVNVDALLRDNSDSFRRSCKVFLDEIARL